MRQMLLTIVILGLAAPLSPAQEDVATKTQQPDALFQPGRKHAYLGLEVEPLPSALSSIVPKGEGVLVRGVPRDSPAAKAGLEPFGPMAPGFPGQP